MSRGRRSSSYGLKLGGGEDHASPGERRGRVLRVVSARVRALVVEPGVSKESGRGVHPLGHGKPAAPEDVLDESSSESVEPVRSRCAGVGNGQHNLNTRWLRAQSVVQSQDHPEGGVRVADPEPVTDVVSEHRDRRGAGRHADEAVTGSAQQPVEGADGRVPGSLLDRNDGWVVGVGEPGKRALTELAGRAPAVEQRRCDGHRYTSPGGSEYAITRQQGARDGLACGGVVILLAYAAPRSRSALGGFPDPAPAA